MVRNILGSLLGLIGAAAVVRSPFRAWYGDRQGRTYGLAELFGGEGISSSAGTELLSGMLLPMLAATAVVVLAVVLRSRLLMVLAGVVPFGFTALWMVREGLVQHELTAGNGGLGPGVAGALSGSVVIWLGALVMRGRRPRPPRRPRRGKPVTFPPVPYRGEEPYGATAPRRPQGDPQGAHDAAQAPVSGGPARPVQWPGMQRLQEQQDRHHRDGSADDEAGHTRPLGPAAQPGGRDSADPDADRTRVLPTGPTGPGEPGSGPGGGQDGEPEVNTGSTEDSETTTPLPRVRGRGDDER